MNHESEALTLPPYYVACVAGSYYTRLFPHNSVHLFHSSFCLHWRSQMFKEMEGKAGDYKNEGNIYIASTTPPAVVKLFQEQFQKDLSLFLELRARELVIGGRLVLTFLGRENEDVYNGDLNHMSGLLSQSLQYLVKEGLVEKEKLDSFNLPMYEPYIDEVKAVVEQSELFDIVHIEMFEPNWDPHGDSEGGDAVRSGENVAKYIRAVMGPLFASHFGESILDELFEKFARNVAAHLEEEEKKTNIQREDKCPVIVLSLRSRRH